jgi:hypothetical protein
VAVGADPGFRGSLSNIDVKNDPARPDHITIQSAPSMQAKITAYIRSAASSGRK